MTNSKMTQKDYFNAIITLAKENDRSDLVEFCEGRIALLDKKASGKKATKTQVENEGVKATILEVLASGDKFTVTEIQAASDELGGLSNQKVSALLRQLVEAGKVEKTVDKKKSYFSAVVAD